MKKSLTNYLRPAILTVLLLAGVATIQAAWTAPTCTPPNCNADAPLNVGQNTQTKFGALILNASSTSQYPIGLTVYGGFKLVDGNEGSGKVLVSDGNGNAMWSTPQNVDLTGYKIQSYWPGPVKSLLGSGGDGVGSTYESSNGQALYYYVKGGYITTIGWNSDQLNAANPASLSTSTTPLCVSNLADPTTFRYTSFNGNYIRFVCNANMRLIAVCYNKTKAECLATIPSGFPTDAVYSDTAQGGIGLAISGGDSSNDPVVDVNEHHVTSIRMMNQSVPFTEKLYRLVSGN